MFTPKDPDFEIIDHSLLVDINDSVEVIKRPIWEPFSIYRKLMGKKAVRKQGVVNASKGSLISKLAIWIRGNLLVPDPRVFWVRPSVNFLSRYLKHNKPDVLITTGPPHSMHLIGLELKRRLGVKWVADFRDPWSEWDLLPLLHVKKRAMQAHRKLEKQVLNRADLILTVSPRLAKSLVKIGATNTKVVMNGFDSSDFSSEGIIPDKFRMVHTGLLNKGRNPVILWELLDSLCESIPGFAQDFELILAGTLEEEVTHTIQSLDHLKDRCVIKEYVSHEQLPSMYASSPILLLLINKTDNARWILPGKLFEYLAAGNAILALGPSPGDVEDVLRDTGAGAVFNYESREKIKHWILERYQSFKEGETRFKGNNLAKYSRKVLTQSLATCLDEL